MIWLLLVTLYSFFSSPPLLTWLSRHQPSCCAFNCSKIFAILFHVLGALFPQILTQPILLFHSSFCSNVISTKGFSEIFMTPALFYLIAFLITWYHLIFIYLLSFFYLNINRKAENLSCSPVLRIGPGEQACMPSCFSHVWFFANLWTLACQALLSMRFRQKYWSGLPCPLPGHLPKPMSLVSCNGRQALYH